MGIAYLRNMEVNGSPFVLHEVIGMSIVGGVPPRPRPEPPLVDPDYGIDIDEGYHPPNRPTHPIALPGDPWWGTYPHPPGQPPVGVLAVVRRVPEGVTPPAESSPQASWIQIIMEKGSPPAFAKLEPYASTGPIQPPAK